MYGAVLMAFDPGQGWPVTFVNNLVTEHLSQPFDLEFGPDGHLHVSKPDGTVSLRFPGS
jgi:hypothetical protein